MARKLVVTFDVGDAVVFEDYDQYKRALEHRSPLLEGRFVEEVVWADVYDPSTEKFTRYWVKVVLFHDGILEYERGTDPHPVYARKKMVKDGTMNGTWALSKGLNAKSVFAAGDSYAEAYKRAMEALVQ